MKSIGEALKKEREKKHYSLNGIFQKTRIGVKTLEALERDDIRDIPGEFYFRNYIKNYLNAIESNETEFLNTYGEDIHALYMDTHKVAEPYCSKLKYSRFKKRNVFVTVAMTAMIFVAVFYLVSTHRDEIFSGWSIKTDDVVIPETGIDFNAFGVRSNFSRDHAPINLKIKFSGPCWTQIIRGQTKIAEQGFGKDDVRELRGYEFFLYIGIPGNATVTVNDQELTYLKDLKSSQKLLINPLTLENILSGKLPPAPKKVEP